MMQRLELSLQRIGVIAGLTYREAVRRRLLVILLAGCFLFMGLGFGCGATCRAVTDSGRKQQRVEYEQSLMQAGIPAEQRAAMLAEMDSRSPSDDAVAATVKNLLVTISFFSLTSWVFLLALFFTPFLALADLRTSMHTLLLARPVARWEYLVGKYLAVLGILVVSGGLLVACYLPLMKLSTGFWGEELLPSMLIALEGFALWTMLLFFLTIWLGRFPAVFLSLLPLALSFIPSYFLMSGRMPESEVFRPVVYLLGYGLPQIGLNLFYAYTEIMSRIPELRGGLQQLGLGQIGANAGQISLAINLAWIVGLGAASIALFKRRELEN
ncbi:MAG: hypothetical protein K1X75_13995 [Leptospirales bacterium]|nr:hypothetical protein [Leptospirales bacterium]